MTERQSPSPEPALEARSPFEMRVDLGKDVPETDVRSALEQGDMGFLHSFTTGSAVDGPGMRVVVWTTGCMWRCQYCHNPDTWTLRNGIPVSVLRTLEQLGKYRHGLQVMSGGVTISGGEPLLQHKFVAKVLTGAKTLGIHTAIETNGYLGASLGDADLASLDLVLLGIKSWDPARHKDLTGREIGPTLDFARRLAAAGKPVWVRFVLVPGLTDHADDIAGIAKFAASLGNVQRVEVLPFHQLGRFKWQKLGIRYRLEDAQPPTRESHEQACAAFRAEGLDAN